MNYLPLHCVLMVQSLYPNNTITPMQRLTTNQPNYAKLLVEQQAVLTALVQNQYRNGPIQLRQIAEYTFEDRGIYHVTFENGQSYVLRAFRYDVKDDLLGQVTLFDYLEQQDYPAPRLLPTHSGASIATYENWMAVLVSYVDGTLLDFSPHNLKQLGSRLGILHALSEHIQSEAPQIPDSRLHPRQILLQSLPNETFANTLPQELSVLYKAAKSTIAVLKQASSLPVTLVHGDCWPHNSVLTTDEQVTLIDWDCAGLGPAILDLGYLLLMCHLGKPQLPKMYADSACITAVVQGYCQQRRPTHEELQVLREAVHFETARRVIAYDMPSHIPDNWQEDIRLQKELAHFAVSDEIAEIALRCFDIY